MKKTVLSTLLAMLALLVVLSLAACNGSDTETATTSADVKTDAVATTAEETETEPEAAATEEATTEEVTTEAATTEAATTEAETTASDLSDPAHNLIPVGLSADGKTVCYDGRFQFEDEIFQTADDYFTSIQDAIDSLEGVGGDIQIDLTSDLGVCLSVNVPDDGNFYRIAYNWSNVDFVFNYGVTYDDNSPSDSLDDYKTVNGYAYYSDITKLDAIAGLDGTHIYIWSGVEGYAPGYYSMHYVGNNQATGGMNYDYNLEATLAEKWPGLPLGETYNK